MEQSRIRANNKWMKNNTTRVILQLNNEGDSGLIGWINKHENKAGAIREALLAHIEEQDDGMLRLVQNGGSGWVETGTCDDLLEAFEQVNESCPDGTACKLFFGRTRIAESGDSILTAFENLFRETCEFLVNGHNVQVEDGAYTVDGNEVNRYDNEIILLDDVIGRGAGTIKLGGKR